MKFSLLLFFTLSFQFVFSQTTENTVTLTTSGTGKTLEEAKNNALRSAIGQAFGAFISAKTEILNDDLVRDEVVSITNGNVKEFKVINQLFSDEQNLHFVNVSATVSLDKLTSFVQSKGFNDVTFNGGGFAMNMKLQKLNESAELVALKNLLVQGLEVSSNFFDQELIVGLPSTSTSPGMYKIPFSINSKLNSNWYDFYKYFKSTLLSIGMSQSEVDSYKSLNKNIFTFRTFSHEIKEVNSKYTKLPPNYHILDTEISFRNPESLSYLVAFFVELNFTMFSQFEVKCEVDSFRVGFNSSQILFRQASYIKRSDAENEWFFNMSENDLMPFTCTSVVRSNEMYPDKKIWMNGVYSESLDKPLIDLISFGDIKVNPLGSKYYNDFFISSLSSDKAKSLEYIAKSIYSGSTSWFEDFSGQNLRKFSFLENPKNDSVKIGINKVYTEQQLEKIQGFKLVKK